MPPPRVRPAMPVVEISPPVVASPNACVSLELAPREAGLGTRHPLRGIDADALHAGQVDDDPVVADRLARDVVAPAADGDRQIVGQSELERRHHVVRPRHSTRSPPASCPSRCGPCGLSRNPGRPARSPDLAARSATPRARVRPGRASCRSALMHPESTCSARRPRRNLGTAACSSGPNRRAGGWRRARRLPSRRSHTSNRRSGHHTSDIPSRSSGQPEPTTTEAG